MMTDTETDLARRLVERKQWRWMEGMAWYVPPSGAPDDGGDYGRVGKHCDALGSIPDISDPATQGCLLEMLAETGLLIRIERGQLQGVLVWRVATCPGQNWSKQREDWVICRHRGSALATALLSARGGTMNADVKEAYDDARGALRRTRATDIYFNRERIKALLDHIDDLEAWLSEMRNLLPEAERTHLDALLGEGEE